MKRLLICLSALVIVGCTTLPVEHQFPAAPDDLLTECPALKQTDLKVTKLSELVGTVVENYGQYQTCSDRVSDWIKWYNDQKTTFEKVK